MRRYRLIKNVLAIDKKTRQLVKLKAGSIYIDSEKINTPFHTKILLCKRYEEVSKGKFDCFDCISMPKNELNMYFEEVSKN